MKSQTLLIALSTIALLCTPAADARHRTSTRSLSSLLEQRANLIEDGASSRSIAAIDARIDSARLAQDVAASSHLSRTQRGSGNSLDSLIERRNYLLAAGASPASIAAIDSRIASARLASSSRQTTGVGVRSTRTSPPYGHAYGYWANGPGSRSIETSSGSPSSRGVGKANGNSQGKGHGNGHGNGNGRGHGK